MADDLPGFIPRFLQLDDVSLLRADEAVLNAMVDGWRAQMLARGLAVSTITARCSLIGRFVDFTMEQNDFDDAWAAGAQLSTDEAIAYARRGRGERNRPDSGWESLTPAEHDVVRLVCEGLGNKEVATRLFVSDRTVQAHLAHVYTKLSINSRVQLAQEAARRAQASVD